MTVLVEQNAWATLSEGPVNNRAMSATEIRMDVRHKRVSAIVSNDLSVLLKRFF